jgi:hypothetical protein
LQNQLANSNYAVHTPQGSTERQGNAHPFAVRLADVYGNIDWGLTILVEAWTEPGRAPFAPPF